MKECWLDLGRTVCARPGARLTCTYFLSLGSLGRVGVRGLGQNLLPHEERSSPQSGLAPTGEGASLCLL